MKITQCEFYKIHKVGLESIELFKNGTSSFFSKN